MCKIGQESFGTESNSDRRQRNPDVLVDEEDRQLIKLATGKLNVENLAHMLDASPPQVIKVARWLGVSLQAERGAIRSGMILACFLNS